jgi:hypothetical protein
MGMKKVIVFLKVETNVEPLSNEATREATNPTVIQLGPFGIPCRSNRSVPVVTGMAFGRL